MISVTPQTLLKFAVRTCQPVSQPLNLICSTYSISPFKDMIQPRLQRLSGGSVLNSLFTFDHNPIMHTRNVFLLPETCRMKTEVTAYLYKSFRWARDMECADELSAHLSYLSCFCSSTYPSVPAVVLLLLLCLGQIDRERWKGTASHPQTPSPSPAPSCSPGKMKPWQ